MKYRQSKQRDAIYDYMQTIHGHVSAENVYEQMKKEHNISLATVYRNLGILVDTKKIKKIPLLDGFVYDKTCTPHYHFYCMSCNTLHDIHNQYDEVLHQVAYNDDIVGEVNMHDIVFQGTCRKCKESKEN